MFKTEDTLQILPILRLLVSSCANARPRFPSRLSSVPKLDKIFNTESVWLHQCWWWMLETKCVGDNFKMLVTALTVFVINILYFLTLAPRTNILKMSQISKFCHQHPKIVTNIKPSTSTRYVANFHKNDKINIRNFPLY